MVVKYITRLIIFSINKLIYDIKININFKYKLFVMAYPLKYIINAIIYKY